MCIYIYYKNYIIRLVVWNIAFISHFISGISSFPLTNSIIFQDGCCTTNQSWCLASFPDSNCKVGPEFFSGFFIILIAFNPHEIHMESHDFIKQLSYHPWRIHGAGILMLTWLGYIDGIHVTIYNSTMDPMGHKISDDISMKYMKSPYFCCWNHHKFRCFSHRERPQIAKPQTALAAPRSSWDLRICPASRWGNQGLPRFAMVLSDPVIHG